MRTIYKFLLSGLIAMWSGVVVGAPLTGVANVNVTSDTAATAKNMAMDEARRQIIIDVLSPYSDATALRSAVSDEKSGILTNMIASSGISGEKLSDTTYSASITMTVDRRAAKNWMAAHDIQNWLGTEDTGGTQFTVVATLNNKLNDWLSIRHTAAVAGIDLETQSVDGNNIVFNVQSARRGALTIALRDAGWRYQDRNGILHIFK